MAQKIELTMSGKIKRIIVYILFTLGIMALFIAENPACCVNADSSSAAYTDEQKREAKEWLEDHGYPPTKDGAQMVYADYLDGKLDAESEDIETAVESGLIPDNSEETTEFDNSALFEDEAAEATEEVVEASTQEKTESSKEVLKSSAETEITTAVGDKKNSLEKVAEKPKKVSTAKKILRGLYILCVAGMAIALGISTFKNK